MDVGWACCKWSRRSPAGHFPPRCRSRSRFSGDQTDTPRFSLPPGRASRPVGAMVVSWLVYIAIRPPTDLVLVFCRLLSADRRCEPSRLVVTRRLPGADRCREASKRTRIVFRLPMIGATHNALALPRDACGCRRCVIFMLQRSKIQALHEQYCWGSQSSVSLRV